MRIADLRQFIESRVGVPYEGDLVRLVFSVCDWLPCCVNTEDPSSMICSELVAECMKSLCLISPDTVSAEISPNDFSRDAVQLGTWSLLQATACRYRPASRGGTGTVSFAGCFCNFSSCLTLPGDGHCVILRKAFGALFMQIALKNLSSPSLSLVLLDANECMKWQPSQYALLCGHCHCRMDMIPCPERHSADARRCANRTGHTGNPMMLRCLIIVARHRCRGTLM